MAILRVADTLSKDYERKVLAQWPEVVFFCHPLMPQVREYLDSYSGENVA